ncbi:phage baseplate assembly protein [Acetobacter cibinongensis]|nr:hypothetical protein [Acetobacter cibinongensis]
MSGTVTTVQERLMTVMIGGKVLKTWSACEVGRDVADIAGAFRITYLDTARAYDALGGDTPEFARVREHDPVTIKIRGEVVLKGFVDNIQLRLADSQLEAIISGRDVTGDMVDCCTNPVGPGEYRQIDLVTVVGKLASPYGIAVQSEIDPGAPFTLVAVDPGERTMQTVEKLSRQRGVLVVSDGIGGLRLTKAGTTRAPEDLRIGDNIEEIDAQIDVREHYSDIWIKGAFKSVLRPKKAALDASAAPLTDTPGAAPAAPTHTKTESQAVVRYGHAIDPTVKRYRPAVFLAATQSGGSEAAQTATDVPLDSAAQGLSADTGPAPMAYHAGSRRAARTARKPRTDASPWTLQDQADWRMRTTRAHGTMRIYTVAGLAARNGDLWKPNALVYVHDPYSGLDQDMLIGAVTYVDDESGYKTRISVVPPDTYDLTGDNDRVKKGTRRSGLINGRAG